MAARGDQAELSDRGRKLLKALVERFIRDGEPVGSRALARAAGLDVSPATVRNELADLEELGLIAAPHTSAGRVPTVRGYRVFVDSLLTLRPLSRGEIDRLEHELRGDDDSGSQDLVDSASHLLSGLTRMAGIVTLPRRAYAELRQIEFLKLSENRVLAVLVFRDTEIQHRVLHVDRPFATSELQRAANYLTVHFAGKDLLEVRDQLANEVARTRERMDEAMRRAIDMAGELFADEDPEDYIVAGEVNLMDFKELSRVDKLRALFDAFQAKGDMLHLLDRCIESQNTQVYIGEEAGYDVLDDCSLVTAPYLVNDRAVGALGVLGPTRMAYERVIPIVDVTARLLGAALNSRD